MTFSQIRQYIKGLLSNIFNKSLSNIAPKFDKTKTYAIGDRVIYNGDLYQFTSAHTGAWVAADANKTDINTLTERMPSGDMEEVASPLPGVMSRRMKYSLQEQVVGEWIDGKPLYQKTIETTNLPKKNVLQIPHNISNIGVVVNCFGMLHASSGYTYTPIPRVQDNSTTNNLAIDILKTSIQLKARTFDLTEAFDKAYITIQYTKTTDTAS